MRYEGLANIVRLAIRLQGAGGLTLDEIAAGFGVSRRTAERMRDAVEQAFGPLEYEETDDRRRHWRLRSNALRDLIRVSADELVELETAAAEVERAGFHERAALLRGLAGKLRASRGRPNAAASSPTWKRSRWPRGWRCGPDPAHGSSPAC